MYINRGLLVSFLFTAVSVIIPLFALAGERKGEFYETVVEPYQKGELEKARKAMKDYIIAENILMKKDGIKSPFEVECCLGARGSKFVSACFELELMHNGTGKVPEEMFALAKTARESIDLIIKTAEKAGLDYVKERPRIPEFRENANKNKKELLLLEIITRRKQGDAEKAKDLIKENADYIKAAGITEEQLLPRPKQDEKENKPKTVVVAGRDLAIAKLVVDYFRYLSNLDADGLDIVLFQSPKHLTGKEVVSLLKEEFKEEERTYDRLGPVRFDDKTELKITPVDNEVFMVSCDEFVWYGKLAGKDVSNRTQKRFTVRLVGDEYKVEGKKR